MVTVMGEREVGWSSARTYSAPRRQPAVASYRMPGVAVREGPAGVVILWPSWGAWRYGKRAPEDVQFMDVHEHHAEASS